VRWRFLILLLMLMWTLPGYTEFSLNFLPIGNGAIYDSQINSDNLSDPDTGQTPFLYDPAALQRPEIVTDPITGNIYYHMIVGSLASGFIQESYVQMGFASYGNFREPTLSASASGGTGVYVPRYINSNTTSLGNGYDPLDMGTDAIALNTVSGNGTANPTRVIMRQLVNDGEIMMEFLKDGYLTKPRISQMLMAPDITMLFDVDMRAITYDDDITVAPMVNSMQLWGPGVPTDRSGDFDMNMYSGDLAVNAGRYTYADGVGPGGSEGTYHYADGAYDQTSIPWGDYFDASLDTNGKPVNPWGFESAKP